VTEGSLPCDYSGMSTREYSIPEIAKMVGLHPITVHRHRKEGHLRAVDRGVEGRPTWMVTEAAYRAYLRWRATQAPGPGRPRAQQSAGGT
jgi:hypothetical protein